MKINATKSLKRKSKVTKTGITGKVSVRFHRSTEEISYLCQQGPIWVSILVKQEKIFTLPKMTKMH